MLKSEILLNFVSNDRCNLHFHLDDAALRFRKEIAYSAQGTALKISSGFQTLIAGGLYFCRLITLFKNR